MEQHVKERIRKQYGNLTASQKIISKIAIEKPGLLAIHTAKKIAELTNTSEATVIRFCYALGYSGYTELQDEIKKSLVIGEQKKGPFQKYRDSEDALSRDNFAHQVIETDIAYLQQSLQQIDYRLLQQAIDHIIRANRIVVVGFRWCHIPAKWLFSSLNAIKGNTHLYIGAVDNADYFLTERDQEWLVIAISFPRHPSETVALVHSAKELGAKILAITEGELSPISQAADLLLKITTPQPVATSGMPTLFSILNVLIKGVMVHDSENVQKRLQHYDEISSKLYSFVGDEEDDYSIF
ncbi:RpiR family transcriptional regulator [Brevibacillus reuszeri]|uniref:Transcriptional regulator n=1 Tax=Brevibacillus reuszeri TaxID=54915 RepID=A0A0K9YQA3_9BACL|nr:MurR/RpiR family transcriptional regulator [Brevibacillus reuszeri]KNB70350.1 transcriptional regulator [Brevibacillus reuszeri]MED1857872.1 MurR/RpiR family transcriptional regulator [Brevibacillus reuszeri]GED71738.1 RpiR family transcriptional regulator [Brevibacillus reuszeri]